MKMLSLIIIKFIMDNLQSKMSKVEISGPIKVEYTHQPLNEAIQNLSSILVKLRYSSTKANQMITDINLLAEELRNAEEKCIIALDDDIDSALEILNCIENQINTTEDLFKIMDRHSSRPLPLPSTSSSSTSSSSSSSSDSFATPSNAAIVIEERKNKIRQDVIDINTDIYKYRKRLNELKEIVMMT